MDTLIDKDAVVFGTAVALGAVALPAVLSAWYRGKKPTRPQPPGSSADWKLVGSLANITIYPLKSAKGITLKQANCTQLGLQQVSTAGNNKLLLQDRYFMLFREDNGEKLTGPVLPNILQISIEPEAENSVRISYPNETDLIVNIPQQGLKQTRLLRGEPVNCFDCGDEAAIWLTRVLRGEDAAKKTSVRLGYWPPTNTTRNLVGTYSDIFNNDVFKGVTNADGGAFSDFTSYMLMISSSVDELNRRMTGIEISPCLFRPNFYVQSNQPPFSDLKWKWVKIGNLVFKYVKGCKRCAFTTFDPETSQKYPNNEPLRTLGSIKEASCTEPIEESPMMGIHLGSYDSGIVRLGDPVYALE